MNKFQVIRRLETKSSTLSVRMKRIAPGFYKATITMEIKGRPTPVDVELCKLEHVSEWYWNYTVPSMSVYDAGGNDWYATKGQAAEALEDAIKHKFYRDNW